MKIKSSNAKYTHTHTHRVWFRGVSFLCHQARGSKHEWLDYQVFLPFSLFHILLKRNWPFRRKNGVWDYSKLKWKKKKTSPFSFSINITPKSFNLFSLPPSFNIIPFLSLFSSSSLRVRVFEKEKKLFGKKSGKSVITLNLRINLQKIVGSV